MISLWPKTHTVRSQFYCLKNRAKLPNPPCELQPTSGGIFERIQFVKIIIIFCNSNAEIQTNPFAMLYSWVDHNWLKGAKNWVYLLYRLSYAFGWPVAVDNIFRLRTDSITTKPKEKPLAVLRICNKGLQMHSQYYKGQLRVF